MQKYSLNRAEVERKYPVFAGYMQRTSDPVDMFVVNTMKWYNYERIHMSLNIDIRETPYKAFINKQPPKGVEIDDS